MAFPNPPKTWTAGNVLTAAQLNAELRDALNALLPLNLVAWTSYTPTLTQSGAVTKTVNYAKYTQFGKLIVAQWMLTATGAGTANNPVTISLPVTAAHNNAISIGTCGIFDVSAAVFYGSVIRLLTTTTVNMYDFTGAVTTSVTALGVTGAPFAAALASTDVVIGFVQYEAV